MGPGFVFHFYKEGVYTSLPHAFHCQELIYTVTLNARGLGNLVPG